MQRLVTLALALILAASGIALRAQTLSLAEIEQALLGTWLATMDGQQRTRQMVVRGVREDGDRFALDSLWGWSDVNPRPASGTARLENGVVILELTNADGNRVTARSSEDGHLAGTFKTPKATFTVRLERISQSTETKVVSNSPRPILEAGRPVGNDARTLPAALRIRNLTVVYISAANCPPCKSWEYNGSSDPKWALYSKASFLATAEARAATFRQIDTASYMNTALDKDWPEDLRRVRKATYAASGTPRFVIVADRKVMLNARLAQMESQVLPKLRELAAKKQ